MYKKKLIALLEGLECQQIPKLVEEKSCAHFRRIGEEIAKCAKVRAEQPSNLMNCAWCGKPFLGQQCSHCGSVLLLN